MKAIGGIRYFDVNGRLVVPKDVRNANGWDVTTPLQISAVEGGAIIQKYQPDTEKNDIIQQLNDVLHITNNESVIKIVGQAIEFIERG